MNPTGSKMSKRDEGSSIQSYVDNGFLPDAVFNYLCLLGWTPKGDIEKLDRESIIALFDPKDVHSANARFDMAKCTWFNAQYLRELSPEALYKAALPFLEKASLVMPDQGIAERALQSVKEKVSLLTELPAWVHYFFREDYPYEDEVVTKLKAKPENPTLLKELATDFSALSEWNEPALHTSVEATAKRLSVKPGALMPLLRFALTGQSRGPGVTSILDLVGKDKSLARLERTVAMLSAQAILLRLSAGSPIILPFIIVPFLQVESWLVK